MKYYQIYLNYNDGKEIDDLFANDKQRIDLLCHQKMSGELYVVINGMVSLEGLRSMSFKHVHSLCMQYKSDCEKE